MTETRLAPASNARVLSIDILRGLTVALMIVVNDPGDWQQVYPALQHAEWNGYTAADLIFPNFLFLAGASLVFSLETRVRRANGLGISKLPIARALGRRAVNLIALQLFLAALPSFRMRRIRIFGVLSRTAFCSLAGGLILLVTLSLRTLLAVVAAILTGYWLTLRFVPIPGLGRPVHDQPLLDPDNNLAAWLDRKVAHVFHGELHTGALFNVTHDPEGLLSSAPALATLLLGACAALLMRSPRYTPETKRTLLALAGVSSLTAGHAWHRSLPINKNLWTSSYVLASAGWSLLALSTLYWLYDLKRIQQTSRVANMLSRPANIFGANALVAYAASVAMHKITRFIHLQHEGHSISLRTYAYRKTYARGRSTPLRSLAFAVTYAAVCFLPNLLLWRKKILVKF